MSSHPQTYLDKLLVTLVVLGVARQKLVQNERSANSNSCVFFHNLISKIANYRLKCNLIQSDCSKIWSAIWKETISVLDLLIENRDIHKGMIVPKIATGDWV